MGRKYDQLDQDDRYELYRLHEAGKAPAEIGRLSFYYAAKGESPETLALMRRIDEPFLKCPFYGSRQMARQLRREGVDVGLHRVRRLMRLTGLEAIYQAPRTSAPHPEHRVYPCLLKGTAIERANQVWFADITYIPARRGLEMERDHGLGDAPCARLAVVEHHGRPVLCRGLERGSGPNRLSFSPHKPVSTFAGEDQPRMDGRGSRGP